MEQLHANEMDIQIKANKTAIYELETMQWQRPAYLKKGNIFFKSTRHEALVHRCKREYSTIVSKSAWKFETDKKIHVNIMQENNIPSALQEKFPVRFSEPKPLKPKAKGKRGSLSIAALSAKMQNPVLDHQDRVRGTNQGIVPEKWIERYLDNVDVERMYCIPRDEEKTGMQRMGIDREKLNELGVTSEMVDRIYRALYVYTSGFHALLKDSSGQVGRENQKLVISNLWTSFIMLLEKVDKQNYSNAVSDLFKDVHEWKEGMDQQVLMTKQNYFKETDDLKGTVYGQERDMKMLESEIVKLKSVLERERMMQCDVRRQPTEVQVVQAVDSLLIKDFETRIELGNASAEKLENKIQAQRAELFAQKGKLVLNMEQMEAQAQKIADAQCKMERMLDDQSSYEMQISSLKSSNLKLTRLNESLNALQKNVQEQKMESVERDRQFLVELQDARKQKQVLEMEIQGLQRDIQSSNEQYALLQNELGKTINECTMMESERNSAQSDVEILNAQINELNNDMNLKHNELQVQTNATNEYKQKQESLLEKLKKLSDSFEKSKVLSSQLQADTRNVDYENELQERITTLAKGLQREKLSRLEENTFSKTAIAELEANLQFANSTMEESQASLSKFKEYASQIERLNQKEIGKLNEELEELTSSRADAIATVLTQAKQLETCAKDVNKLTKENNNMKSRVSDLEYQISSISDSKTYIVEELKLCECTIQHNIKICDAFFEALIQASSNYVSQDKMAVNVLQDITKPLSTLWYGIMPSSRSSVTSINLCRTPRPLLETIFAEGTTLLKQEHRRTDSETRSSQTIPTLMKVKSTITQPIERKSIGINTVLEIISTKNSMQSPGETPMQDTAQMSQNVNGGVVAQASFGRFRLNSVSMPSSTRKLNVERLAEAKIRVSQEVSEPQDVLSKFPAKDQVNDLKPPIFFTAQVNSPEQSDTMELQTNIISSELDSSAHAKATAEIMKKLNAGSQNPTSKPFIKQSSTVSTNTEPDTYLATLGKSFSTCGTQCSQVFSPPKQRCKPCTSKSTQTQVFKIKKESHVHVPDLHTQDSDHFHDLLHKRDEEIANSEAKVLAEIQKCQAIAFKERTLSIENRRLLELSCMQFAEKESIELNMVTTVSAIKEFRQKLTNQMAVANTEVRLMSLAKSDMATVLIDYKSQIERISMTAEDVTSQCMRSDHLAQLERALRCNVAVQACQKMYASSTQTKFRALVPRDSSKALLKSPSRSIRRTLLSTAKISNSTSTASQTIYCDYLEKKPEISDSATSTQDLGSLALHDENTQNPAIKLTIPTESCNTLKAGTVDAATSPIHMEVLSAETAFAVEPLHKTEQPVVYRPDPEIRPKYRPKRVHRKTIEKPMHENVVAKHNIEAGADQCTNDDGVVSNTTSKHQHKIQPKQTIKLGQPPPDVKKLMFPLPDITQPETLKKVDITRCPNALNATEQAPLNNHSEVRRNKLKTLKATANITTKLLKIMTASAKQKFDKPKVEELPIAAKPRQKSLLECRMASIRNPPPVRPQHAPSPRNYSNASTYDGAPIAQASINEAAVQSNDKSPKASLHTHSSFIQSINKSPVVSEGSNPLNQPHPKHISPILKDDSIMLQQQYDKGPVQYNDTIALQQRNLNNKDSAIAHNRVKVISPIDIHREKMNPTEEVSGWTSDSEQHQLTQDKNQPLSQNPHENSDNLVASPTRRNFSPNEMHTTFTDTIAPTLSKPQPRFTATIQSKNESSPKKSEQNQSLENPLPAVLYALFPNVQMKE